MNVGPGGGFEPPETRYARTADGAHLAYQVCGDGPLDLVLLTMGGGHVEVAWEVPTLYRGFQRLASFSRLIRYDYCGSGMSDPLGRNELPSLETRAAELLAVLDAVGAAQPAIVANNVNGLCGIFFAASYPNRVSHLVLDGCYARLARAPDYPFGVPDRVLRDALAQTSDRSTSAAVHNTALRYTAPHAVQDPEFFASFRRLYSSAYSPAGANAEAEMNVYADVRALLPSVQAPTLVLYRRGDQFTGKPYAEYLAANIPNAALVEVPGNDNFMFVGNDGEDLDEIEEFLTGARHVPVTDRVLATVLFTDIVGSTERASELGDRKWRELIDAHDRAVRRQLERFRGTEVHGTGDGFLARFDGPGRAIDCASAIRDAVRALDIEVRVGLHTGEIDVRGDDVAGVAVHIGARICALTQAGEVLVSSTVKDLVVGSGFEFEDRGEHELKGVPGTWRLFRVES